jgi:formylglycine-generating enzyme required for sulfatase activity
VEIGDSGEGAQADEQPVHEARLDAFLIDVEPVSTTAYCRFLSSIGEVGEETLHRWFILAAGDRRSEHLPIAKRGGRWEPVPGAERWPMVLVSWHGASAYSRWANGMDWEEGFLDVNYLPSEAQWEYAARGPARRRFPWGNEPAASDRARVACHRRRRSYALADLPLADVNEELGLSPFGLRHMAGNVWQWCRDDYDPGFYSTAAASRPNPVCRSGTLIKSERGGSWIGPADLARSSYRRGRPPLARGRCLGFRCVGEAPEFTPCASG